MTAGNMDHMIQIGPYQPTIDGPVWTTETVQDEYHIIGFPAHEPYGPSIVAVRRRTDGVTGTLEFTNRPRLYFNFEEVT